LKSLTRRQFLQASTATALALGLNRLGWIAPRPAAADPVPGYDDFRDIYREKWTWDKVVRGTHTNVNCVSSCAWNLFVREGIVWREEQSSPYTQSNPSVPDFNPRGCQKGASCSDLTLSASRVTHPMKRVGPRGSGRFKRISWEEALGEVAGHIVDVLAERGGEGLVLELGPNQDYGANTVAGLRFFRQLGAPITDSNAQIGDLAVGGTITLGTAHCGGTSDDWFRSDYLVLWGFNPVLSRIPDAHFVPEARYGGTRVVTIAPDYSQCAIHSDLWLSPRPATDAALALAACQVVMEEGLYDAGYLREQTDLTFLIRSDNRRFLREADVVKGGRDDRFAMWDASGEALFWAPGTAGSSDKTLALPEGVFPSIEARKRVSLADGRQVEVRTAFSLLRERLAGSGPEQAAAITSISADAIRRFAREFAKAPSALIVSQLGMCKNLHSDLIQRSQILLASLTGNLGREGGGWRSGAIIALDGMGLVAMQDSLSLPSLAWSAARAVFDYDGVIHEFDSLYVPSTIFHAVHGGLLEFEGAAEHNDPMLPEGSAPYLKEAVEKGHFPVGPPLDASPPEIIFSFCGNVLRHSRMGNKLRERFFEPARLVVDVNFRINETGRYADILLPAAAWYEKIGIKYIAALVPYVTLGDQGATPMGEAKPEWEIFSLLSKHVAEAARARGASVVRGFRGQECEIAKLDQRFSDDGRFGPGAQEEVADFILTFSRPTRGISLEDLRREGGAMRIKHLGVQGAPAGIYSEYQADEPVAPLRDFVEKKEPYPTLTGRQQFYVDHPWFLKVGEELPVHKDPPTAGGQHPFTMTGGHARWSIHSMWRDQTLMLQLQRGEPVVYLNPADARERGISDHDLVRVWNDLGEFVVRAKITPGIRPSQLHILHAWEPYQFRDGGCHQYLSPSPFKVTQLVGDYGQLHWGYQHYEPNQNDRDTRVDVARFETHS
jgi:DMSO reductase family type II enzyme molybdopterin subunit